MATQAQMDSFVRSVQEAAPPSQLSDWVDFLYEQRNLSQGFQYIGSAYYAFVDVVDLAGTRWGTAEVRAIVDAAKRLTRQISAYVATLPERPGPRDIEMVVLGSLDVIVDDGEILLGQTGTEPQQSGGGSGGAGIAFAALAIGVLFLFSSKGTRR
jgi:hypothetical protein